MCLWEQKKERKSDVNKNREKEESYFDGLVFFCGQANTFLWGKKKIIGLGSLGIYGKKELL
jgi:hypothetical protein